MAYNEAHILTVAAGKAIHDKLEDEIRGKADANDVAALAVRQEHDKQAAEEAVGDLDERTDARLDALESDAEDIHDTIDGLTDEDARQAGLIADLDAVKADRNDVSVVAAELDLYIAQNDARSGVIESDVADIQSEVSEVEGDADELTERVSALESSNATKADRIDVETVAVEQDADRRDIDIHRVELDTLRSDVDGKAERNDLAGIVAQADRNAGDIKMIRQELIAKADMISTQGLQADQDLTKIEINEIREALDNRATKAEAGAILAQQENDESRIASNTGYITSLLSTTADLITGMSGKVPKPVADGTSGQVLSTDGEGGTNWIDPAAPSDEQIEAAVTDWLDEHPEATTTIEDGAVTMQKLSDDVQNAITEGGLSTEHEAAISAIATVCDAKMRQDWQIEYEMAEIAVNESKLKQYAGRFTSTDGFGFMFFTDPHSLSGLFGATPRTLRADMEHIGAMFRNSAANFVCCGGDWQNIRDTLPEALWQLAKVPNMMRHWIGERAYTAVGNHEGNHENAISAGTLTWPQMARMWYARDVGYYTIETDVCKTVVFDAGYSLQSLTQYQWTEVDWFAKLLLNNTTPHVIGIGHIMGKSDGLYLGDALSKVADAFNRRDSLTLNGLTYDFGTCVGTYHFSLSGHYHSDSYETINNVPTVFTDDFATSRAIDCCYADFAGAKLYCDRIGGGSDRVFDIIPTGGYQITE